MSSYRRAVFTWTNLLVVVVELDGNENEALDLVPLVTNVVLEEHHLIVGVVVVVDPGVVPINSRGEKQRMHLRDGFLAGLYSLRGVVLTAHTNTILLAVIYRPIGPDLCGVQYVIVFVKSFEF